MNQVKILLLTLFFVSSPAQSFYTEIGANYSFQREVYGAEYESQLNENSVLGSVAFYFFSLTGLEISYSWRKVDQLDKTVVEGNNDIFQTGYRRTLYVQNFNIGISQYFNSTKAFLRPGLGVGYTRRLTKDSGYTDIYDNNTDTSYRFDRNTVSTTLDLIYVLASLKIRVVEGLFISGSVRTLFAPKKYTDAQNNLRYYVGFSWLF